MITVYNTHVFDYQSRNSPGLNWIVSHYWHSMQIRVTYLDTLHMRQYRVWGNQENRKLSKCMGVCLIWNDCPTVMIISRWVYDDIWWQQRANVLVLWHKHTKCEGVVTHTQTHACTQTVIHFQQNTAVKRERKDHNLKYQLCTVLPSLVAMEIASYCRCE